MLNEIDEVIKGLVKLKKDREDEVLKPFYLKINGRNYTNFEKWISFLVDENIKVSKSKIIEALAITKHVKIESDSIIVDGRRSCNYNGSIYLSSDICATIDIVVNNLRRANGIKSSFITQAIMNNIQDLTKIMSEQKELE
ncbi:MAG: hypothetical protein ACRDDY_03655 [Clostridium sp.]|uniref:hypothetical protein n=1 Tax=Clostridium sp. TaxID=1506 RepID=UPI003EE625F0